MARTSRRSQSEKTDMVGSPIFMTHFPDEMEAFCVKHIAEDRTLTGSVDLVMPGVGEIVGESMKIDDDDELISLQGEQARPDAVLWHTDQRKYVTCPHGGYGLGTELFVMWLLGETTSATSASTRATLTTASRHHRFPENPLTALG